MDKTYCEQHSEIYDEVEAEDGFCDHEECEGMGYQFVYREGEEATQ